MILGYHVVIGAYGFWLPNDRRGAWSSFVGSWELLRFGKATTVNVRRSVAGHEQDWFERGRARQSLRYPAVNFDGHQAKAIAMAFGRVPGRDVESVVIQMKGAASRTLDAAGIHPQRHHRTRTGRCPKMFARSSWNVFLDCRRDIERSIGYVRDNPLRERRPIQRWSFITPFDPSRLAATRP